MQNFQRSWDLPSSAGSTARGVISGVGKGIVGVFTKPIGGAAELVSQTGYGESRRMMMMMMMMMIFGVMK
jgi:vacuolar protein sorting-associated protein 13B